MRESVPAPTATRADAAPNTPSPEAALAAAPVRQAMPRLVGTRLVVPQGLLEHPYQFLSLVTGHHHGRRPSCHLELEPKRVVLIFVLDLNDSFLHGWNILREGISGQSRSLSGTAQSTYWMLTSSGRRMVLDADEGIEPAPAEVVLDLLDQVPDLAEPEGLRRAGGSRVRPRDAGGDRNGAPLP